MSIKAIHPSTLDGIKRLAKTFRVEQGIQHVRALDAAAQSAGFQNFKHARNMLPASLSQQRVRTGQQLFLTVYWRDSESGGRGRETLALWLETQWSDLITPAQLKIPRAFLGFLPDGPDHLARRELAGSQSQARRAVCAAARTMQFMDATKLRPSKGHSRAVPRGRSDNVVPGCDHYSIWYDPASKHYLFADEPYEPKAQSKATERATWALRHNFTIVKPSWPGMYNPGGGSRLFLNADSQQGVWLASVVAALDQLPPPIVEETWDGDSSPSLPFFVSPGTNARAEIATKAPEKSHRSASGPRNTVGYTQTFVGPRRRPNAKMPIKSHEKVGELLKSVLVASYHRKGVYNRLNGIRSELDEWTQREYSYAELPNEQFFDLYYHESGASFARTISNDERIRHIGSLESVKDILARHYPGSPALRALLKRLDTAIKSMQTWGS